ncbi:MAG TPA: TolC family protein [Pseudobdellovibrionaceae bacterium]|nr:TolC family protein [Pseudobdellovibrionaceae bacterium]
MVKFIFFSLLLTSSRFLDAKSNEVFYLNQQKVAQLALNQSRQSKQVLLGYELKVLAPISAYANYEWKLTYDGGFQHDNSQSFQLLSDYTFDSYLNTLSLAKVFPTGTTMGLSMQRTSRQADYGAASGITTPRNLTSDIFSISAEQSLWNNYLGRASQSAIEASQLEYQSALKQKNVDLQNVVLNSLKLYWSTYVAQLNFKQALAIRDSYTKLVASVKRKSSLGYANPAELTQVLAELENHNKEVKESSNAYLTNIENLLTNLNLDNTAEVQFEELQELPPLPYFKNMDITQLRQIEAQKLKLRAADETLNSIQSSTKPTLNLVGKFSSTGIEEEASESLNRVVAGNRPSYYLGLKFQYTFGYGLSEENYINKKAQKNIEEIKLSQMQQEAQDRLAQQKRTVEVKYQSAVSAQMIRSYRKQAVKELENTFQQGRTDISLFIDAMNKQYIAETQYTQAVGNYNIALADWFAFIDQLIPDKTEN